ncbi:WXG100 family type VII secretion target [Nocardia sp. CA-290969]|uniref:WXG100 family type VII secretion target n=1 Tax=Nocardia sp. CA-290969 TaxID=3239986 RepID=UPI003D8F8216
MSNPVGRWLNETLPGMGDEAPPEGNPLIADGTNFREQYFQETAFFYSNVGFAGEDGPWGVLEGTLAFDAWKVVSDFNKQEWVDTVFGAINVGATVYGAFGDPFGFVGAQIAGWMLDHVEYLRRTFDALAGNPEMVEAYAQTWTKIAEELTAIGGDWQAAIDKDLGTWSGETATAYRNYAATSIDHIKAAGAAGATLASMTEQAAKIVDAVRSMVRDILVALAGALIGWTIELAISCGTAAPVVAVAAMTRITAESVKISALLAKLGMALKDMAPFRTALAAILNELNGSEEAAAAPA